GGPLRRVPDAVRLPRRAGDDPLPPRRGGVSARADGAGAGDRAEPRGDQAVRVLTRAGALWSAARHRRFGPFVSPLFGVRRGIAALVLSPPVAEEGEKKGQSGDASPHPKIESA